MSPERFLYISSGAVYGDDRSPDEALSESSDLRPHNLYASTKYTSELITRTYGELYGFSTASVRLSSPYGPMERVTGHRALMSVFYEQTGNVVRGEPLQTGDRSSGRDYTYVADTVAGICSVVDATSLPHDVYNISCGRWTTPADVLTALQRLRPSLTIADDPGQEPAILRASGVRGPMDVTRIREDLGFTAKFDLAAGLEAYLRWREDFRLLD